MKDAELNGGLRRRRRQIAGVLAVAVLATMSSATTAAAQNGTFSGVVVDYEGNPIAGAEIQLGSVKEKVISAFDGSFRVEHAPTGLNYYAVQRDGFMPTADLMRFSNDQSLNIALEHVVASEKRDSVEVQKRATAQWEREIRRYVLALEAARYGNVLIDQDIAERSPNWTSDLFQTMPGFSVVGGGGGARVVGSRSQCLPSIFLDGQLMRGIRMNDIAPGYIKVLVAYRGAGTVPPQFQDLRGNLNCGTIVVFTI